MGCAHKQNQDGFTLVEISIVMIIIGLLIGGTFGGMKLIENMQVNKTVQDLKAIESAVLTFKDTYGRLPGDLANPAARLPNCTVAPCATAGNGDRQLSPVGLWYEPLLVTHERFTFWSHLNAANLTSLGNKNVLDMSFGEGQPESPVDGGYRVGFSNVMAPCEARRIDNGVIIITGAPSEGIITSPAIADTIDCLRLSNVDSKIDDGLSWNGKAFGHAGCNMGCNAGYNTSGIGHLFYDARF